MWDVYYRDDAQGPVARYAGQRATREPLPDYDTAEAVRRACPNATQMETREASA